MHPDGELNMKRPYGTVTQEMKFSNVHIIFAVSVCEPAMDNPNKVELRVGRWFMNHQSYPSTVTVVKKFFNTTKEAWDWAFERGYLQAYYKRVWCRKHRVLHTSGQYTCPAYEKRPAFLRTSFTSSCTNTYLLVQRKAS